MESYDVFAPFYDAVQGDRAEHARYIRSLIAKHHQSAKTVLELACGTGSVLKQLYPLYEITGTADPARRRPRRPDVEPDSRRCR